MFVLLVLFIYLLWRFYWIYFSIYHEDNFNVLGKENQMCVVKWTNSYLGKINKKEKGNEKLFYKILSIILQNLDTFVLYVAQTSKKKRVPSRAFIMWKASLLEKF